MHKLLEKNEEGGNEMLNEIQEKINLLKELETTLKNALGTDEVDALEEVFSKVFGMEIDPVLMTNFFRCKQKILKVSKELEYPVIDVYKNYNFSSDIPNELPIIKLHNGMSVNGKEIPSVKEITVKSPSNNISEVTFTVIGKIEGIDLLDESL